MLEVDHTARSLEMSVDPAEVIHDQSEPDHLLAKRRHYLIELHLMEHLLIETPDILAKSCAIDEHLHVGALHFINVLAAFRISRYHSFSTAFN